jgi:hypothetical protein
VDEPGEGALTITKVSLALEIVHVIPELLPEGLKSRSVVHILGIYLCEFNE